MNPARHHIVWMIICIVLVAAAVAITLVLAPTRKPHKPSNYVALTPPTVARTNAGLAFAAACVGNATADRGATGDRRSLCIRPSRRRGSLRCQPRSVSRQQFLTFWERTSDYRLLGRGDEGTDAC
jgi:hypothetical protein